jgi:hypothetical protein
MSDLCTLGRMARHLGVKQKWLRTQAETGAVHCLRAGRQLLFSPTVVFEDLAILAAKTRQDGVTSSEDGGDDE